METGGHVFTVNVTGARAINEIYYPGDTKSTYSKGSTARVLPSRECLILIKETAGILICR
jgi:hypothetical protein